MKYFLNGMSYLGFIFYHSPESLLVKTMDCDLGLAKSIFNFYCRENH